MKAEQLIGITIPVIYCLLVMFETKHSARKFTPVKRWRTKGVIFLLMILLVGTVVPFLLPLQWLKQNAILNLSDLGLLGIPAGLLLTTFFSYWFHRAEHRFNWLWRATHRLHHSAVRIDISGAFYTSPIEVVAKVSIATLVNFYVLGLSPLAAASAGVIGAMLSMFQHWNINTPHWLGYLIPRPESHLLHHAKNIKTLNYGDLPLWDMIFGTFENPREIWAGEVGV